jgi:ADP-heptose:LPS heptosyltransferase
MRVIAVNTSRIGDLVSGMGVVNTLRDRFGAVDVLADERYSPILEGEPGVRAVSSEEAQAAVYDLLIDLSSSPKSERFVRRIRARRKIGLAGTLLKRIRARLFHTSVLRRESRHIVETYTPILRLFGVTHSVSPVLTDNRNARALGVLEELRGVTGRMVAGFHFDAASERRVLPEALSLGIIGGLSDMGASVLLIGTDRELARRLEDASGGRARFIAVTLAELKTILAGIDLFVGPDSGPLHIAAALGVPSVGVYGPNIPELSGPLSRSVRFVQIPLGCRPCNQNRPCPNGVRCLTEITPEMVLERARLLLAERKANKRHDKTISGQ